MSVVNPTSICLQAYDHLYLSSEYILLQDKSAASYEFIIDKAAEFKKELDALNLGKSIPVGTADAGSAITSNLAKNVDYVMVRTTKSSNVKHIER